MIATRTPPHIDPYHWHQSIGYARQACARIFRDGGSPGDALKAFGLTVPETAEWSKAVELIAERLCIQPQRKAA